MITVQGLYNTAVCYTPALEEKARQQIQSVCNRPEFAGSKIRIMPDVHAGKGCTIGTTMTIHDKIVPRRKAERLYGAVRITRFRKPLHG